MWGGPRPLVSSSQVLHKEKPNLEAQPKRALQWMQQLLVTTA